MKYILIALLLVSLVGNSQVKKPVNPDADDYYCTNNYEWYYDTSYSKHSIKIDLDATAFMEWVFEYWEKSGGVTIMEHGYSYKLDTWKRKGKPPLPAKYIPDEVKGYVWGWHTPKTAKELWLEWYKIVNECWWE